MVVVGGGRDVCVCVCGGGGGGGRGGGFVHMQKMPGVFYPFMREPGNFRGWLSVGVNLRRFTDS